MSKDAHNRVEALLGDLSEPQREAVTHTDGPLLILAGPGSGKTRVVTRRAAYLAATVTRPYHILAITFTNKAAREMRERMDALGAGEGMTVGTFHALCAKLLRWHHELAGVPKNFTIFDTDDRRKLIKKAVEECDLPATNFSPASVEAEISRAKNVMVSAEQYATQAVDWRERTIARIFTQYEKRLREMGGMDFDDLLMRMAMVLAECEELRSKLEDRYQYVLVDEYQDTNSAQYKIARLLTRDRKNLCATGDPDQSIYGWRGADIENILSFERDYPGAKVVRLEENYRSTKRILAVADRLIGNNLQRKAKSLWTQNADGPPVRVVECEDGDLEAEMVAGEIQRKLKSGTDPGDIAVFYRVNSLSRAIEEAFLRGGLQYQIARGVEFYNRKEIKDVLAYLRVLINPADEIALLRIINTPPRGIGDTTVEKLARLAAERKRGIFDLLSDEAALSEAGRSSAKVKQFAELIRTLTPVTTMPAPQALDFVISHSGLRALYRGEEEADDSPSRNLDELINAATAFQAENPEATLVDWLEHAALISDVDAVEDGRGKVTLMTLHAAKGLEFPSVYIVGLEEGLLPFRRYGDDDPNSVDIEEERRLLFVGMTRAKKELSLSHARYRMLRGVTQRTVRSPFLDELPDDQVEWRGDDKDRPTPAKRITPSGQLPVDIAEWTIGTLVQHPGHGLGKILSIHRGLRRTHVDIQFQSGPRCSWVLEFADLKRVEFDDVGS
jgi:DNA helicase-2/ATP-dependent DNA helicase PcrA